MSRFLYTALIVLNKQCESTTNPHSPTQTQREAQNSSPLGTTAWPQKCLPLLGVKNPGLFTDFPEPHSCSTLTFLKVCPSLQHPPTPTDVKPRSTRTEKQDRCHYTLPSPVGAKIICPWRSPTKLEILAFEVLKP